MQVRQIPMEQLVPLLEEQLKGGHARLPVTGSSMLPMLRGGRDVVGLVPLNGPPGRGAVLLYRRDNGQYVLHRAIRMEDEATCLCCGDNQWQREYVALDHVIAQVDRFCRNGKWIDVRSHRGYRTYTYIWTALFPVRRPIIAVRRVLGRLRGTLRRDRK